ncbi:alpha/beta fold hydrolase [Mycobacterium sp.]|uniref:alpha/beta fold hydrolase n=1 Tax=Mycobacterium sp. TaxID=1785 RepID=UPI003F9AE0B7
MLRGLTAGYRHPGRLPHDVVDAYCGPVFGTLESSRAFARLAAAISSADLAAVRPRLAQLKVPTLLVWGTDDLFFPLKWAQRLADLIAGTTTVVALDGARMHFPDERAAEFLPLLRQHWATHQ